MAAKAFQDGFYDLSLESFKRFIKRYPDSSYLYETQFYIGRCLFFKGQFIESLSQFESLLKNPKTSQIQDGLNFWIAEVHFKGKDYKKAASFYYKVIEDYPDSEFLTPAYYSVALCMFELKDYAKAVDSFSQLISKFPKHPLVEPSSFKMAQSHYLSGQRQQAKSTFNEFIKDFPKSNRLPEAFFFLAEIFYYQADYKNAVDFYQRTLEMLKTNIKVADSDKLKNLAIVGIAWCYINEKKIKEAKKVLLAAEVTDAILLAKAAVEFMEDDLGVAIEIYNRLIRQFPESDYLLEAFLGKAEALYNRDSFDIAVVLYREMIDRFSNLEKFKDFESKIYYGLAWSYLKIGQFQEAINEFDKIAKTSNDEIVKISALCQMGDTYQETGQLDKALETYDEILKSYPDSLYSDYVQFQVAASLYKSEQLDAAILSFRALLDNFPKTKLKNRAQYYLGLVYFQQGNYKGAIDQLNKFLTEFRETNLASDAMYLLASSFYNLGEYKKSLSAFERIFKENIKRDEKISQAAEYEIANCLFQLGKEKEALQRLKVFLKKHPESKICADVFYWLGEYYMAIDNFEIARRYFRRLLSDFPEHELSDAAFFNIAVSYSESERFKAALKAFSQVRDSKNIELSLNANISMAEIYLANKDHRSALAIYDKLLQEQRFSAYKTLILTKKADSLRSIRDYSESLSNYRDALKASSREYNPEILFKIAEVEEERGNLKLALENYLKISYLPGFEQDLAKRALLRAARICETQRNWKEAKKIYNKLKDTDFDEAKYAYDRLNWIEKNIDKAQGK